MCRVFGSVSAEPISIRHELLEADNPMIRQSEEYDSGWGMAVYPRSDGSDPRCLRFPDPAYADHEFREATDMRGRIHNVHVRRATMGGLSEENTHPFCMGAYSFGHNGTVLHYPRLQEPGMPEAKGETDSEVFFNFLLRDFDRGNPVASLRRTVAEVIHRSPFSGLNFLFSDGDKLFAYRLGVFELHWLSRPGQLLVASERVTDELWHTVHDDVLLVVDPDDDLGEPHAERLVGDEVLAGADIRKFHEGQGLRGAERGAFAAERAAKLAASASE